jgi:HSP20 family protein
MPLLTKAPLRALTLERHIMIDTAHTPKSTPDTSLPAPSSAPTRRPALDVRESAIDVVITADMPGVPTDGIDITVINDQLTVHGRRSSEQPDGYRLRYQEYRHADYACTLSLSAEIDSSAITATMTHGVLRLVLPKVKAATPRRIAVTVG